MSLEMEVDLSDSVDNSNLQLQSRTLSCESGRSESSVQHNPPRKKAKAKRRTKAERDQISQLNPNFNDLLDDEDEEDSGKLFFYIVEL